MSKNLRYYCDLSEQTASDIIEKRSSWMNFLDSAANMYKYRFADQLLIYSQRPNATACAPIEMWNTTFHRWVQPGVKGIALIDDSGTRPRLKYVYDVGDTHTYGKSAPPIGLWELKEEHKPLVLSALAKVYDDVNHDSISETFHSIANQMADEYYEDNTLELRFRAETSFLDSLDDDNLRAAFTESVSSSMVYLMMKRCGFNTEEYFSEDDFSHILSFNTPDMIHSLGEATSDLSQQVLRDVELVVKKYERQKANEIALAQANDLNKNNGAERNITHEPTNTVIQTHESDSAAGKSATNSLFNSGDTRSEVYSSGGLPSAEHSANGGLGRETVGQIRNVEEIIPGKTPQDNIRSTAGTGTLVPPLQGSGGTRSDTIDPNDEHPINENNSTRQGTRHDGMDSGNERHQSPSGGTGVARTDLRRNLDDDESLFQVETTPNTRQVALVAFATKEFKQVPPPITENLATTLATSSITSDEVDSILKDGGNAWKNSIQRITAHYAKYLPSQENVDYLRDEYLRGRYKYHSITEGGKGFQFGNNKISVWWNEDGIKIGCGDSAIFAHDFALITWEQAAERIQQLYDAGHYVNHDVLEEALNNEYFEVAESLLNIYRDDFRDIDGIEMPESWGWAKNGWPDTVENIIKLLKDKGENGVSGEYSVMLNKLRKDIATFNSYEGQLYRQWHSPYLALHDLEKLILEPHGFQVANIQNMNAMRFITNDEINNYLTRGSNVSESKMRIFSYFLKDHTTKEHINFLKDTYGWSGGTWIDGWSNAEPSKGIVLKRPRCEDVKLKWPAVVKQISELVQSGRYMPNVDLNQLHNYEMIILSRQVKQFFETLPVEERNQSPFSKDLDFSYPKQNEWDTIHAFFDNNDEIDACLDKMQYIFDNTHKDDRYYDTRKAIINNLTSYHHGEYQLFPGVEEIINRENKPMNTDAPPLLLPQKWGQGSHRSDVNSDQLTIFDFEPVPIPPSVAEQQTIIARAEEPESEILTGEPIINAEVDAESGVPDQPEDNNTDVIETANEVSAVQEPEIQSSLTYEIGDIFQIDNKPWQIEEITELNFVHLKNLGKPSTFAVFDNIAVPRSDFGDLLAAGKIYIVSRAKAVEPEPEPIEITEPPASNAGGYFVTGTDSKIRQDAINKTVPQIPLEKKNNIILYQMGDFYEAYGNHADQMASLLDLTVIEDNNPYTPLRFVGFPADKLAEYTDKIQIDNEISFTISSELTDGTRDLSYITHPFHDLGEWEQYIHITSKDENSEYVEPFVVIRGSESPNFENYERHTFMEADRKFKEVESAERELRIAEGKTGGYHKTDGVIFYKESPSDTTLSRYEFRYDIGDYDTDRSGLYNHVNNFWRRAQERLDSGEYIGFKQSEIDSVRNILVPLLAQHQYLPEQKTATENISDTLTADKEAQIKSIVEMFGLDENLLRELIVLQVNESSINVFGRFDKLVDSADRDKVQAFSEKRWGNTPSPFQKHIRAVKFIRNFVLKGEFDIELEAQTQQAEIPVAETVPPSTSPPPVFFLDWDSAKHDFDLTLYQDGDIIGYNKDGVETKLGRMNGITYTTGTGVFWGSNVVPGNIHEQIEAYNNDEVSEEQVRENYLGILAEFVNPPDHMLQQLLLLGEKIREKLLKRGFTVSDELISKGVSEYNDPSGKNNFEDIADFIEAEYLTEEPGLAQNPQIEIIDDAGVVGTSAQPQKQASEATNSSPSVEPAQAKTVESAKTSSSTPITPLAPSVPPSQNFRITDNNLGTGGAKTKYKANIDAITTLQAVEADNRYATHDEQGILSRYVGWGGIAEAFDDQNTSWSKEYAELRELLSPMEYDLARDSVLNAHYTSPTVIKAIYDTVERLGFKSGNLLEPAMGVGNFFGLLPDSMKDAKLYGVELDSITARIAKQLYPQATIKEMGYEKTNYPDSFFDVAVGNVPFGSYGVHDKRYNKHKFMIHDYFFGKTLDQVRPGGIVAFITSKGTLDKQNPAVRKYLAQRAELLGAVRLPNTAFKDNAGTEVTTDIIFLQKRDRMIDVDMSDPKFDWVHLGQTDNGIPINRYFVNNPEMMLGTMADDPGNRMYGSNTSYTCVAHEGADLADQLKTALFNIQGQITIPELDDLDGQSLDAIPANPSVKNFSYTIVDDRVYFREDSVMYPVEQPAKTLERIKGMVGLRDCVRQLIDLQVDEHGEEEIEAKQVELNTLYDAFVKNYGLINSNTNNRAFATGQFSDNAYYLLCALEILDEDGNLKHKGDMFTKRTIKQNVVVTHVDTATEALAVSMGEKACVDMGYMWQLTGKDEDTLFAELPGIIYKDFAEFPDGKYTYRTADEFLSGNIRHKLKHYSKGLEYTPENHPNYATIVANIAALEKVMPKALEAHEINLQLGSTWVEATYVQQFMYQLLKTSQHNQDIYRVNYHAPTGEWQISGKGRAIYSDILANVTYGTKYMNAYEIFADTLNLKDVRVYDYKTDADGRLTRELNKKETMLAQQKQEQIKQEFKNWIFKDPHRRETLVKLYNEKFNSIRPRTYDGRHIRFVGINPEEELRKHQINAIARILYGGNALLAHAVGAGKTWEIVAAVMESKRLGLANKSLISVPNHLTEQWGSAFLHLYPSANILVATKKDFEIRNRKKFIAKIATGDYDAVIIGHTQLEKIPLSAERQQRALREQINEIEDGIREIEASKGDRFTVKQLAKTRKSLEARLSKLANGKKRDDVINFEQLGVDRLYIDESHFFKNLALYSKMRNVAGLNNSDAQKSSDLFMKTRYMDELTTERFGRPCGTIFATGTPISNSIAEMFTIQRYLQYDLLKNEDLTHFDAWASTFCEPQTSIELSPEGTGYRARTRLSTFHNLPELMAMFKEVADVQTADMLDLPVPKANFETVLAEPSDMQKSMVQDLAKRASMVQRRMVDARVDNMLKITTDGRKIGLDQRLMNPVLPDFEGSKINSATDNIFRIWEETTDKKLTQLVFSDFSTPNKDGRFNIYDDIRSKLIERGIPESEVAFIHDADSESKKKELFAKVRQGRVRVLFGSTQKMGAGTNVQEKLIAIHDVDCPWRPADLEQRAGRIIRQGNHNDEVSIFRYATTQTFDSYLWQTVEAKQKFIAQIMTSKSPVRSCEDVDETALSYAEIKALCAGNPLIATKMNLDIDVARLRMLKADHQSQIFRLEDDVLKYYPKIITGATERIVGLEKDIALFEKHNVSSIDVQMNEDAASVTANFAGMVIASKTYTEKEPAAKALLEVCATLETTDRTLVGEYMGFEMSLQFDSFDKNFNLSLKGNLTHSIELGTDAFGNITRINNIFANLPAKLAEAKDNLMQTENQLNAAKEELTKPFLLADELAEKELKLVKINTELNIGNESALVESIDEAETADGGALPKMSGTELLKNGNDYNSDKRTDSSDDGIDYDDDDIAV